MSAEEKKARSQSSLRNYLRENFPEANEETIFAVADEMVDTFIRAWADSPNSHSGATKELLRTVPSFEEKLREHIAYRIRAELVCCKYDRTVDLDRQFAKSPKHQICHWGEAAARIAEEQ